MLGFLISLFEDGWANSARVDQVGLLRIADIYALGPICPSLFLSVPLSLRWLLVGAMAGLRVGQGGVFFSDFRCDMIFKLCILPCRTSRRAGMSLGLASPRIPVLCRAYSEVRCLNLKQSSSQQEWTDSWWVKAWWVKADLDLFRASACARLMCLAGSGIDPQRRQGPY